MPSPLTNRTFRCTLRFTMRALTFGGAALLALGAAGCVAEPNPPPPPWPGVASDDVRGGTRLRANWLLGPDGFAMPSDPFPGQFHDLARDEDCAFGPASDGRVRCLPANMLLETINLPWGRVYSDATCSSRVVAWPSTASPLPALACLLDGAACPSRCHIWTIGALRPASSPTYYRDSVGACVSLVPSMDTYYLVAEVPPTQFVAAVQADGETRSGVTEVFRSGEDGSRQALGLRVVGSSQYGWPLPASDGVARLLPTEAANLGTWTGFLSADAVCSEPAVVSGGDCSDGGPTTLVRQVLPQTGQWGYAVHAVGARLATLYQGWSSSTCQAIVTPYFTGFRLGAELPPAQFREVTAVPVSGRLVRQASAVGDGWVWKIGSAIDTTLGLEVHAQLDPEGVERWIPWPVAYQRQPQRDWEYWYFTDAACLERLVEVWSPDKPPKGAIYFEESSAPPTTVTAIRTLGPAFTGSASWRRGPAGACGPALNSTRLYLPGPVVPGATFAPVGRERR